MSRSVGGMALCGRCLVGPVVQLPWSPEPGVPEESLLWGVHTLLS